MTSLCIPERTIPSSKTCISFDDKFKRASLKVQSRLTRKLKRDILLACFYLRQVVIVSAFICQLIKRVEKWKLFDILTVNMYIGSKSFYDTARYSFHYFILA